MNNDLNQSNSNLSPDGAAAGKRPWHKPDLQEIDALETQNSPSANPEPADTTIYTT